MSALVPLIVMLPLLGAAITLIFGRSPRLQVVVTTATVGASVKRGTRTSTTVPSPFTVTVCFHVTCAGALASNA